MVYFKNLKLKHFWLVVLFALIQTAPVWAFPPLPSSFYGTVKNYGNNVPDGTTIGAVINGVTDGQTSSFTYEGESWYFFDVLGDDPETSEREGGREGETITFKVNGQLAIPNAEWHSGVLAQADLNITDNIPTPTPSLTQESGTPASPQATSTFTPTSIPHLEINYITIERYDRENQRIRVIVHGKNFKDTPHLLWENQNGKKLSYTLRSMTPTKLYVELIDLHLAEAGMYDLAVTNPDGEEVTLRNALEIRGEWQTWISPTVPTNTYTPYYTNTPIYYISQTPVYASPTPVYTINPTNTPPHSEDDQDDDGIPDDYEEDHDLNPNNPNDQNADPDHDGLTNLQEYQHNTDPHNPDTDGDGLSDGEEVLTYHTNPLVVDTDGDGLTDYQEVKQYHTNPLKRDTDDGGVDDKTEIEQGTDPLDPNTALITGIVYEDKNKNNQLDPAEPGLAGLTVELHSAIQESLTDQQGRFNFSRVSPGDHFLTLPAYLLKNSSVEFQPSHLYNVKENDQIQVNLGLSPRLVIDILPKTGDEINDSWLLVIIIFLLILLISLILLNRRLKDRQKIAFRKK